MNKKITIVLPGPWVLSHRGDDQLPIQFLVSLVKEKYGESLSVEKANLTELRFTVSADITSEDLSRELRAAFNTHYELGENENVLELTVEDSSCGVSDSKETTAPEDDDADKDDVAVIKKNGARDASDDTSEDESVSSVSSDKDDDEDEEDDDEDESESLARSFFGGRGSSRSKSDSAKPKETVEACMKRIDGLIGGEEFKALARELSSIAPTICKNNAYDVFASRGFVFSINSGYGLSTYLKELAALMNALGLRKNLKEGNVEEVVLPAPKGDNSDSFNDVSRALRYCRPDNVYLICVDISEWMNSLNTLAFRCMLNEIAENMTEAVIVFRVPFVDKDVLERVRFALSDVLFVRLVTFPPLNTAELRQYAAAQIEKYGFRISRNAWTGFDRRITEEKSDGRFYGLHTVSKVVKEMLYAKYQNNARRGKEDFLISKRDTAALCAETILEEGMSAEEMLSNLVGSDTIRSRILEIVSQIVFARKQGGVDAPCIHMRFVGNPGTGKTTVARIIGKLLKENGVLRIGDFHEHAGRDLCGRYIGETAPKTTSICRDAYGSVLFIDEAYTLYRGVDNDRDYGREALDTLIAEMENHRNDMVIIMAGYADEMDLLMKGNAGLASRMPYVIEFPNFTREQLYDIFMSMMSKQFKYEDTLPAAVKAYFESLPDTLLSSKEFSNARFVRNLFERTWAKATMRCQLAKISEITLTKDDFDRSTQDREFSFMMSKKKNRIGFYD
ncbi:MAG: AAA family ATPase [Clostridia bacterium]|nr:AAA family ATPase [Clostridia bacterium]